MITIYIDERNRQVLAHNGTAYVSVLNYTTLDQIPGRVNQLIDEYELTDPRVIVGTSEDQISEIPRYSIRHIVSNSDVSIILGFVLGVVVMLLYGVFLGGF